MPDVVGWKENGACQPLSLVPFHSGTDALSIPRRRSFSYSRLPVYLINLNIIKLDGTSFDVQVSRGASVRELKVAVMEVFGQSKYGIKENISWTHVWGQFCLSYRGLKLIDEKALLKNFGIKDGDQLHFIRHISVSCALAEHQQRCHGEWRRKSWSGAELVQFDFGESTTEKRRNKELIHSITEDTCQSPNQQETNCGEEENLILKNNLHPKLSSFFKNLLCYYNPIYIMRACSGYRGC